MKKEKQGSDLSSKIPDYLQSPIQIPRQQESALKQVNSNLVVTLVKELLDLHSNEDGEVNMVQSDSSENTSLLSKNTTNEYISRSIFFLKKYL